MVQYPVSLLCILCLTLPYTTDAFWPLAKIRPRLILPVLGLLFGSLLKCTWLPCPCFSLWGSQLTVDSVQATFDYYFSPNEVSTPVYAGLVPIEIRLLRMIRTADLWVYFQSFTSILLSHPRYAVPFPTDYCSGSNCISVLLPGGLEMVRQVSPALNLTVFNGGIFDKTEAIRVEASRGMALAFERVSPDFSFDWSKDCIYPGAQLDDGVQLCVQQSGNAIIAGWTSCPQAIFDSKQCTTKRNQWAGKPMDWTTKLTARFQSVTVTYDRNNGSIVDAKAVFSSPSPSSPSPQSSSREENIIPLSAADYLTLFKQILIPPPPESNRTLEITKINSITYDLTWLHRTYQVSFPDQKDTPLSYLRNFLAVPLQFGVVATAFANYSTDPLTLGFILGGKTLPLPEEMRTVAIGGRSTSLLVIRAWTGWTFIAGTAGMLAACVGGIGWLMMRRVRVFGTTGIPELDILRVAGQPLPPPPPPPAPCCSLNPFNSPHSPHFLNSPHTLNSPNSLHALNSPRGYTHMQREMSEEMMMTSPRRIFTGLSDIRSQKDGNTRISGWRLAAALRHWEVQSVARQDRDGNGEALIVAVPRDRGRAGRGEII